MEWNTQGVVPLLTLIGGKLTTCRALAEDVVAAVAPCLQLSEVVNSRARCVPGGEDYPANNEELRKEQERLAERFQLPLRMIQSIWLLCGTSIHEVFAEKDSTDSERVAGTNLPLSYVMWVIEHEWVSTLDDLVERRLMLLFQPELSVETLRALAGCLVMCGKLEPARVDDAVDRLVVRLREVYGRKHLPAATVISMRDGGP